MSTIREPEWLATEREYEDELERYGTIPELFETSAERHLDRDAQLYKGGVYTRSLVEGEIVPPAPAGEYAALTYREMRQIVRNLAVGFREIGFTPDDRVGIYADTRMEWAHSDLGLLASGCVVTTVYTDSSTQQVQYLLDDPNATGVVVENETLLDRVFEVEDELDLEAIVLVDEPSREYDRDDVYTLAEVHDRGEEAFDEETYQGYLDGTNPGNLASLIYTSGTTGKPKGVQLTHWNFRSNFHQIRKRVGPREDDPDRLSVDEETRAISFLPLAHVFERQSGHFLMFGSGASVGYAESTDTIAEDIVKIKPTAGGSVPRVYERIFASMNEQAGDSGPKRRIFDWALEVAKRYQMADSPGTGLKLKHAIADKLVYSNVKENLGGNIELMVSGGGSLSKDLCRIFNGMGITIVEGYGLTETSPVVTVNSPDDIRPGTLGVPLTGVDIAIDQSKDVDGDFEEEGSIIGELLVRGDNVTSGYWNRPGATERAFTADPFDDENDVVAPNELTADGSGKWFRTGDLVEQTTEGFLIFHDRLKQLFVLDTGKNVAPQLLEDEFATSDRIEQIMVLGDNRKFVGALVVPNFTRLEEWADSNDISLPEDPNELVADDRVRSWIQDAIDRGNQAFEKHEQIKAFALVPEEWTPENDYLTPSMKKKRETILEGYGHKVEEIYSGRRNP